MYETARFLDSYRRDSEDRAEVLLSPAHAETVVLIVADGVGGREFGGAAAERAIALARETTAGNAGSFRIDRPEDWYYLLHRIDTALSEDPECGQTTLVAVAVTPRRLVGASVGDSEAWWVDASGHFDLTGGQQRKPYLGTGMAQVVPFSLPTPSVPGTLLVASDGLFKHTSRERILDTVAASSAPGEDAAVDLDGAAKRLGDLARLSSGQLLDDIAILLCRGEGRPPPATLADRFRRLIGR